MKADPSISANRLGTTEKECWTTTKEGILAQTAENLKLKIESLTPEQLAKVEALIDSMRADAHTRASMYLSEPAFEAIWDDPENDLYDAL